MSTIQYRGKVLQIGDLKVSKTGFSKRTIKLQPEIGNAIPIQFHRDRFGLLSGISEGDQVSIDVRIKPAGATDTVNLVASNLQNLRSNG